MQSNCGNGVVNMNKQTGMVYAVKEGQVVADPPGASSGARKASPLLEEESKAQEIPSAPIFTSPPRV